MCMRCSFTYVASQPEEPNCEELKHHAVQIRVRQYNFICDCQVKGLAILSPAQIQEIILHADSVPNQAV